jgi:hypothetical protein
MPGFGEE